MCFHFLHPVTQPERPAVTYVTIACTGWFDEDDDSLVRGSHGPEGVPSLGALPRAPRRRVWLSLCSSGSRLLTIRAVCMYQDVV